MPSAYMLDLVDEQEYLVGNEYEACNQAGEIKGRGDQNADDEAELELGLGLGLGVGTGSKIKHCKVRDYCRILTAEDFPSVSGIKRSADADTTAHHELGANTPSNQLVGWPPIRSYRMNSLATQSRGPSEQNIDGDGSPSNVNAGKSEKVEGKVSHGHFKFVKVNMDGVPIGRKVDLKAHACYETLAQALEDMFLHAGGLEEYEAMGEAKQPSKLLDGSSEFALTYEDRDGDWMLVGDVPWGMFLRTARRLRIMRTCEANVLGN